MKDYLNYEGKICVVTGAASGVGAELVKMLVEMKAVVYALDIRNVIGVHQYIATDLSKKEDIDKALEQLPQKIDCFFQNAALPGVLYLGREYKVIDVFTVNYVAAKYLVEELSKRMTTGGSIAVTSSITGNKFREKSELLDEMYVYGDTFEKAVEWGIKNKDREDTLGGDFLPQILYIFTKEALNYLVIKKANELLQKGIRINAIAPGAIDTDMTPDFGNLIEKFEQWDYAKEYEYSAVSPSLRRDATAKEQADGLIFLNSDLAKALSGSILNSDLGFQAGVDCGLCTLGGILL